MASNQTFSKVPSVFSFQRSMLVSAGAFFNEIDGQDLSPVYVVRHGIRGSLGTNDVANRDTGFVKQTETALLDVRANALVVKFGVRMIDLECAIFSCASGGTELAGLVRSSVNDFVARAKTSEGLIEVSRRIARNVANGSFLWRNRVMASTVTVTVDFAGGALSFDSLSIPLTSFGNYSAGEMALAEVIANGLRGDPKASIEVTARVDFGVKGAVEVFPSQAFIEDKSKNFARPLYKIPTKFSVVENDGTNHEVITGQAAFRDQKISNRLRTFDTWYADFAIIGKPLPIEPNGASIDHAMFFRSGSATASSMFSRLNQIDPDSPEGMFCIGSMIRGGVYSGGSEKADKKAKPDKASGESTGESTDGVDNDEDLFVAQAA